MSKAMLYVTEFPYKSVNILDHTDKLIVKIVNYDVEYDEQNNKITTFPHNSTL